LGLELADIVYYPPETTDFSAFATKVMASNPQVFCSAGGGTIQDYLSVKFVREAGYEGLVFMYRGVDPGGWSKVGPLDPVNGTIGPLMYTYLPPELMPAITKESKDAYIAKYGSWDDPVALFAFTWYVLQDALEKAQSLDPDKVAQVMASGLKFDTAYGPGMMISRPDQDNPRTIDALYEFTMATLEEGEIKVLDQVSADKAFELIKKYEIFGVYPD
jgi:ABC-type branched-subunit amino acid transport system substrate-binding protein